LGATQGVGFAYVGETPFDIIINATSASLSGEIPPIPAGAIGPQTVCYDLAYGRSAMAFVNWAREAGCARAVQGLGMLVEQAAESFRLWRGVRPQTAHVLAALKARSGSV
ncbi:MAG: shikimate dehydrogenase, partial [Gammaproteobacteria bacterium]|nr:shikimate dehydrogenase [Gammaproteobacteria bacterium]